MSTSVHKFNRSEQTTKFPFLVLAVAILLTIGITYIFYQSAKNKDAIRFTNEVNRLHLNIENKINLYIALLKGGRGFIDSNRLITRENFNEYVESLDLKKSYNGVQGIGYAKVVSADERQTLTDKMKFEGDADFQIFPIADKDVYAVIVHLEPLDEHNRQMIGFDLASEAKRRAALETARDTGEAVSSAKINIVEKAESAVESGFLICLPIYKNGESSVSAESRKKNITGYIYSPFRAGDFLSAVQDKESASDILLRIYDGEPTAENLLAQTDQNQNNIFQNQIDETYSAQKELSVAGRKWAVHYNSLPQFAAQSSLGWSPLILTLGIIFSFLLFGMTYWEASARIKLQATAADLFAAEQQKQHLLEKEQAARHSAEQANRTKDEFIAVVSHELRTPLNAIGGWSRILGTADISENTKTLALEKIDKNLRLQTKLIEELLDYSQIVSETVEFESGEVNFSNIFEGVFSEIEPSAREKSIEFVKDNQLNGHLILGDANKLKIVIHNLLNNAVKFTSSGGQIKTVVTEKGDQIQMIVKDNGRGINAEFLPLVFDRFSQADTSSTRASGGFGLGLTISNHIIKLHNGNIKAVSPGIGQGSTFTITVPRCPKIF